MGLRRRIALEFQESIKVRLSRLSASRFQLLLKRVGLRALVQRANLSRHHTTHLIAELLVLGVQALVLRPQMLNLLLLLKYPLFELLTLLLLHLQFLRQVTENSELLLL